MHQNKIENKKQKLTEDRPEESEDRLGKSGSYIVPFRSFLTVICS